MTPRDEKMADDPFAELDALTKRQKEVLGQCYITNDLIQPNKVKAALEAKGWLESYDETLPPTKQCRFPIAVRRYHVPLTGRHFVVTRWLADQCEEGDEG